MNDYLKFVLSNGNLIILASDRCRKDIQKAKESGENIDSDAFAHDLMERQLCNGWEEIAPEDVGALTSGLILTNDCVRNADGKIIDVGRVYWHERYQIESIGAELMNKGKVTLIGRD